MKHGEKVRLSILDAGLELWGNEFSASAIARKVGLSHGSVLYHFKSSSELRDAVAYHAMSKGDKRVIPMLIWEKHPCVANLSRDEKQAFLLAF